MQRTRFLPLAALLTACASAGPVLSSASDLPRTHSPAPTVGAITPADLMTRLYIFADDSMLGREAGTLGNVRGTDYVAREMARMGLEPAGENGGWFQTVPIRVARLDSTLALTVDGSPLRYGADFLPFYGALAGRALPQGAGTRSIDGVPVIYGGTLGGTIISPADAAGKLVIFTVAPGENGRRDWRFYQRASLAAYGAAAGIAGVTLDVLPAASRARLGATQMHVRTDVTGTAPLTMMISPSAAQRLLGVSTLDPLAPGTVGRTVRGALGWSETDAPYPARNVIGVLRGRDAALRGQYVAIGAHNDHIGLTSRPLDHDSVLAFNTIVRRQGAQDTVRTPTASEWGQINRLRDSLRTLHGGVRADSVNNGADDDGSGTVTMLEIAERFATAPEHPRRSLIFVSHTGEEKGLWGSEWFTDHPTVPRDSIVAQLNMDMVGRGKPTDAMGRGPNNIQLIGPRRLSTQLGDVIDAVNANRTPHMEIDASFDANGHPLNRYCRSDHYMYARYGIPITYFSLGYHTDYHQVTDEPQYIDYEHMARVGGFVHDIAEAIANRDQRLVVDKPKPDPHGGCRQ